MGVHYIWKITIILFVTTHTTLGASLRCYECTVTNYVDLELKQSQHLVNTSYIKLDQELVIVIHGYAADDDTGPVKTLIASLIENYGDTKSICALNWKKEASAYVGGIVKPIKKLLGLQMFGIGYFPVSLIAGKIGHNLGKMLFDMKARGLRMEDVYLIGHAEGAHLAGAAGRTVKLSGDLIGRITGLDATKFPIEKALDKSCAKLVDLVHTDFLQYGSNKAIGHIDFWINYGCGVQPGCKRWPVPLTVNDFCSHTRALSIMSEAVYSPCSMQGRKAKSFNDFRKSRGTPAIEDINMIGFDINPNYTGSFFLCTNDYPEFGKGPEGMNAAKCECPFT